MPARRAKPRRDKGSGSVRNRGNRWEAIGDFGLRPDGKRDRRSVYGRTKEAALAKLATLRAQHRGGRIVAPDRQTVAEYLEYWLADVAALSVGPTTLPGYRATITRQLIPRLGQYRLQALAVQHVQQAFAGLQRDGYAPATLKKARAILGAALNQAVTWGLLERSPCQRIRLPAVEGRQDILSVAHAQALLKAARDDPHGPLYVLALTTGLRQGELLALRWEQIDLRKRQVRVQASAARAGGQRIEKGPKSRAGIRVVPLPDDAVDALTRYRQQWGVPEGLLFPGVNGRPLDASTMRRRWHRFAAVHGLPRVRVHDMRHTYASMLLAQGASLVLVQALLGHSSPRVTLEVYGHRMPHEAGQAVERLNAVLRTPVDPDD
jgi:integrase